MLLRRFNLFILMLLLIPGVTQAQKLSQQNLVPGKWINSWLVCGPLPYEKSNHPMESGNKIVGSNYDYTKIASVDQNLGISAGNNEKYSKSAVKWKLFNSPDSMIYLDKTTPIDSVVVAYAYTEVAVDKPGIWNIALGGTVNRGGLKVNGIQVWEYSSAGKIIYDNGIPIFLKKGKNTLLLKIEQKRGRTYSSFNARFFSFQVGNFAQREKLFTISSNIRGTVLLSSQLSDPVIENLVQDLDIEIFNYRNEKILKNYHNSGFVGKLNIKTTDYQPYTALLDFKVKNGEVIHQKIPFFAGKRSEYILFTGNKTGYRIALDSSSSASELWAAKELQHWLKEISGADFPIQTLDLKYKGPQIVIGYNELIKYRKGSTAPADMDESFHYCNSGPDILIYGGKQRGTMYGVMTFLENELGCRWYTPSVSVIPKKKELKFSWYNHSEKPGIRVRNDFYFEAFDPTWAAWNKMNGRMDYRDQPGGSESYWNAHTFYQLMPPSEFFDKHPEYYSLIREVRTHERTQLCLSNPDVLKIITERIRKRMRESPEYLIYDVSQNDWLNPCQCDKCQAIVKREGSESGLMIWFVNQVAQAISKEFPDKFIGTLAYQYTRTPPKNIQALNNVVVRLSSIECCFSHSIKSDPKNQLFLKDLKGWSALAPHLYIWDYVVNFSHYMMPFPNLWVLQSNIQTFRENKAIGVMEEGGYQSRSGAFTELKTYVISRLLWNPDCNVESVINDFIHGYYGRSGEYILKYLNLVHTLIKPDTHINISLKPNDKIFSDDFVLQSCELFDKAEKVADNEDVFRRVELAYSSVLYLKCLRMPALAKYDGSYDKFCHIAGEEGITHYAEDDTQGRDLRKSIENAK